MGDFGDWTLISDDACRSKSYVDDGFILPYLTGIYIYIYYYVFVYVLFIYSLINLFM
jgi:hypothetical protein